MKGLKVKTKCFIAMALAGAVLLSGCSGETQQQVSDFGSIDQVSCEDLAELREAIDKADTDNPSAVKAELEAWLKGQGLTTVKEAEEALAQRTVECDTPTSTPTASPATPGPVPTVVIDPVWVETWGQAFDQAPPEIAGWAKSNNDPVWRDAKSWPDARSHRSGEPHEVDARVIITRLGQDTPDDEVRARVNMPEQVGIVRVKGCKVQIGHPDACPKDGETIVILAPLQFNQEGEPVQYRYGTGLALGDKVAVIEYK